MSKLRKEVALAGHNVGQIRSLAKVNKGSEDCFGVSTPYPSAYPSTQSYRNIAGKHSMPPEARSSNQRTLAISKIAHLTDAGMNVVLESDNNDPMFIAVPPYPSTHSLPFVSTWLTVPVGSGSGHPSLLLRPSRPHCSHKSGAPRLMDNLVPDAILAVTPAGVKSEHRKIFPGDVDGTHD